MAGLANMIIQSGLQHAGDMPDTVAASKAGAEMGAQLAQTVQGVQKQRADLEMRRQELQMQKANSITDTLRIAAESKDPRMKKYLTTKVLPAKVNALGMNDFFSPQTLEMIQVSDDAMKKVLGLQLDLDEKVRSGQMTGAEAYKYAQGVLSNPEEFAILDTDQLFDAQKFKNSEEGKSARAEQMSRASMGKQIQGQQAAGKVEASKKTANDYSTFMSGGGMASAQNKLNKLREAKRKLESGEVKTGSLSKALPVLGSDRGQAVLDPAFKSLADDVRGAISLKGQLDSQFSAKEAETQFNRAIDGALPTKENIKKIDNMIKELESDLGNKVNTFRSEGFEVGGGKKAWTGLPAAKKEQFKKLSPSAQKDALKGLIERFDVSIETLKKDLGL